MSVLSQVDLNGQFMTIHVVKYLKVPVLKQIKSFGHACCVFYSMHDGNGHINSFTEVIMLTLHLPIMLNVTELIFLSVFCFKNSSTYRTSSMIVRLEIS